MIKPRQIPKKGKGFIQKQQRAGQRKNIHRDENGFFHKRAVLLTIILIITFVAFLPSVSNQFIKTWDDNIYVTDNPMITHLNWESIKGFFTTQTNATYVPIPLLSWALEFKFFGLNPLPYHLNNLLLHLLCTSLIFYFLILLRLPVIYAALGALLFGIHPMRVETVAWVTERKDLIFCLFYLGALLTYIKYIISENGKPIYFVLTLLLFVFSLFSKIQAVSVPLILLLLDYWLDRPLKLNLIWEKIPFFVLSIGFGLAGYFILQHLRVIDIQDRYTLVERIFFGLYSLSAYIVKLILPIQLSSFYPYPVAPGETLPLLYYLNPVCLLGVAVFVFLTSRKTKAVVFGVLFYLFNVMFLLQFVRAGHAYQADRFTYLSYIGLFFIIAWAAHNFVKRNKFNQMVMAGLTIVFTIFFFINTYSRCMVWKDDIMLWNDVIKKYPGMVPEPYDARGSVKAELKDQIGAIQDFNKAIELDPNYIKSYVKRGLVKEGLNDFKGAIQDYSKVIELDPNYIKAYVNRALVKEGLNDFKGAIQDYSKVIELDTYYISIYIRRGLLKEKINDFQGAILDFDKAIYLDPKDAIPYNNRGKIKGMNGAYSGALLDLNKAIELDSKFANAYNNRGLVKDALQDEQGSIQDFNKAIFLDPKYEAPYLNLARTKRIQGDLIGEIAYLNKAIKINPQNTDNYILSGQAKYNLKNYTEAIQDYNKAIMINPDFAIVYCNRGLAKIALGDNDGACNDFNRSVQLGYQKAIELIKIHCK